MIQIHNLQTHHGKLNFNINININIFILYGFKTKSFFNSIKYQLY